MTRGFLLIFLLFEAPEVLQELQPYCLTLLRVELDGEDVIMLHSAGELDPIRGCGGDIIGVLGYGVVGVDKVEEGVVLDPGKEGGLLFDLYGVPAHVGDGVGLARIRILNVLGEPRHLSPQGTHPSVSTELIALLKEEL